MSNRKWSPEDDALIRSYADAGLSARTAARALGVTRNAVIGRADRLGDVHFHAPNTPRSGTVETARKGWETRRLRYGQAGHA